MANRDNKDSDPPWPHTGREPPSDPRQTEYNHASPSREDDVNSTAYGAPLLTQEYQAAQTQPLDIYNPLHFEYPLPRSFFRVKAFPPQRPPAHNYSGPAQYAPPSQVQPAPAPWIPSSPSHPNAGSGDTESRTIGVNTNITGTDHRIDAQIAASNHAGFIRNPHFSSSRPIHRKFRAVHFGNVGAASPGHQITGVWRGGDPISPFSSATTTPPLEDDRISFGGSEPSGLLRERFPPSVGRKRTLADKIQPLGNPSLVPFIKEKHNESLRVEKGIDGHIPLYMCSNIIDPDTVAFWYPDKYRAIQLGDLGYFNDSCEFHPILNIFRSYDKNTKDSAHPPSQPYPHLSVDLSSVVQQVNIPGPKIYTSSNIERTGQETGSQAQNVFQFRTCNKTGRSGAIIVLPTGGSTSCIPNYFFQLPEVKQHFHDHAPSWYQHALPLLPNKTNGSLVLIRATHCTRHWGFAAFAEEKDIEKSLSATFVPDQVKRVWLTNDYRWTTRANISFWNPKPLNDNQCVGAVISCLRLDEGTWKATLDSYLSPTLRPGYELRSRGLRHSASLSSLSDIHVQDNSEWTTRRLLHSRDEGSTESATALGDDGYTLLYEEPH